MFSALLKAFTARAGFLSSILALLLIALTSAAVLLSLPRIEQDLENSGQTVLSDSLSRGDTLVSFRAEGRNLLLEGQFEDAAGLSAKLNEIEGVRSVIINGSGTTPGVTVQSNPEQPAEDLTTDEPGVKRSPTRRYPDTVQVGGETIVELDGLQPRRTVVLETPCHRFCDDSRLLMDLL